MKTIVILLAVCSAPALRAAPPETCYVKKPTWVESMLATRAALQNEPRDKIERDRPRVADALFHSFSKLATDWFAQDTPEHRPGEADAWCDFGWYFAAQRSAEAEQKMVRRVLDEVGAAGGELAVRLAELVKSARGVTDPGWLALYADACRLAPPGPPATASAAMPPTGLYPAHDAGRIALRLHRRPIRRPGRAAFCAGQRAYAGRPSATVRSASRRCWTTPAA